mmetsp:Transcript_69423/g.174980  ORF Transcript_69423/g.174980 Transcript_69423/m.174980 type:complete len:324 (-) Transcript_69423:83-1054(-)
MAQEFLASALAACSANLVTHPLETIRIRQVLHPGVRPPSTATMGWIMIREEGASSLYKGLHAALMRGAICGGGRIAGYTLLKDMGVAQGWLTNMSGEGGGVASSTSVAEVAAGGQRQRMVSVGAGAGATAAPSQPPGAAVQVVIRGCMAMASGALATLVAVPTDLIRTRQAAHRGKSVSVWSTGASVVEKHGVRGLWAGSGPLIGRVCLLSVSQLLTYDKARALSEHWLHLPGSSPWVHISASASAGLVATTVSCPLENVKTIIQNYPALSTRAACRRILSSAGYYGFFRGWFALYLRLGPHTVTTFLVLERLRCWMGSAYAT